MNFKYAILGAILLLELVSCPLPDGETNTYAESLTSYIDYRNKSTDWTVMYYVDGDNNLETYLLDDISELSEGLESTDLINVIALVDRVDGYSSDSSVLGSDFTDTRLFRIGSGEIYDIPGKEYFPDIGENLSGEYNMGDGETLKSFIEYCKAYYPAENYALIFSNHGGGVRGSVSDRSTSESSTAALPSKAVCYDDSSNGDCLYTAEITDILDSSHSVDLMVYDACDLGLVEIAYQYRPNSGDFSADYMAASSTTVWGYGLPYDAIFERISRSRSGTTGYRSNVKDGIDYDTVYYSPSSLTPKEFGLIIVEEQERSTQNSSDGTGEAFSLYDLSAVEAVVGELNNKAASLGLGTGDLDTAQSACIAYEDSVYTSSANYNSTYYPHYDLYDFGYYIDSTDSPLENGIKEYVDDMVVASFGGSTFSSDFKEGEEGLGFFFPDGDDAYLDATRWAYEWWYTGEDTGALWDDSYLYGKLDFCTADDDGIVDGWFELLQSLYNPYDPQSQSSAYDAYHPGRY